MEIRLVCARHSGPGADLLRHRLNGVLAAGTPLAFSTWAGRTGLSEIPPLVGAMQWRAWAHRVRLDRNKVRAYAHAVYASTDAFPAKTISTPVTGSRGRPKLRTRGRKSGPGRDLSRGSLRSTRRSRRRG